MTGGPASGLTPGLTLGQGTGEIANSQCRVFAQGSSYAVSGNTLTLVLSMAFTSGFTGNKVIYMAARDVQEAASGWRPMGVARIPEPVVQYPLVGEMTPGAGSGAAPLLSFTFSDSTNVNNLRTVWMLVNSQLNAPLACYLAYSVPQNWLYLFSNAARPGEITSMPMDGNGMIENSQCRVTADLQVEAFDPSRDGVSAEVGGVDWLSAQVLRLRNACAMRSPVSSCRSISAAGISRPSSSAPTRAGPGWR